MKLPPLITILLLCIVFSSCKVNHFVRVDSENYSVENSLNVPEDSTILALVTPYRRQLEQGMNQVIGSIAMDLEEASGNQLESLLGNFVAEAFQVKAVDYTKGKVDFSVVNSGGLRISMLPKGPIKKSLIYELLPFENILVILELDGATVQTFVNHMRDNGVWPVSEGLYYQITQSGVGEIRINGALLEADKIYSVAMPDYIANGGGDSDFLIDIPQLSTQKLLRDVVIEFIQESPEPVGAEITGRIEFKN